MLCLSCCPGKGEVSPLQPSSPLRLLAASSAGPALWRLETTQSGVVEVLVVHEQTPRQPLVPCSREALEPRSQQRTCGLQAAWIPCKRQPPLSWSSGPNPSAGGGEPGPNPEGRDQGALWVSRNSAAETKILLAAGSVLPLPIEVTGPVSRGPRCSFLKGVQCSRSNGVRGPRRSCCSAACCCECSLGHLGQLSVCQAPSQGPGLLSWCCWPGLRGGSAHPRSSGACRVAVRPAVGSC